jgi:hypothetical protein
MSCHRWQTTGFGKTSGLRLTPRKGVTKTRLRHTERPSNRLFQVYGTASRTDRFVVEEIRRIIVAVAPATVHTAMLNLEFQPAVADAYVVIATATCNPYPRKE